ncbi:MAG: hypothetical protein FWG20_00890 [Candidatus Cloacimonetes bacterium]|nr:hypothetical protein [Candidatus Cloacimonadota bacterium]
MMNLQKIDRRWIFLFMLVGVMLPLIFPIGFKIEVMPNTKAVYDLIDSAKPGDRILMSFDFDPGSGPELSPVATAITRHAIEKDLKIVYLALWPMGVNLGNLIYEKEKDNLIWGENFINLGYIAGGLVAIQSMGRNFTEVFPTDANGNSIHNFPILKDVKNFSDFAFVVSISAGTPGIKEWIMSAGDKYGLPVTGGTTAVSTPGFLPYVNTGQLHGIIGGLKQAAEYEMLIGQPGTATSGMDAQSIAHIIIIIFIIIGNIAWYRNRKQQKEAKK